MKRLISSVSVAAMVALGGGAGAYAQDAAPAGEGSLFSQKGGIETVISSAQKKEESVQEVPLPVTAFSGLAIERKFAVNLEDLNKLAPAVQLQHVGLFQGSSAFTVRGIGTSGVESFDDPHVAVFIDGVYQPRNAWALGNLLDIESVEMLRGPQGTIYGRNAYSGAITLRTKRPDVTEYSGKASLQYGNPGKLIVSLVGNVPIVQDKFAMRLATQFYKDDGFYRNNGVIIDSAPTAPLVTHIDEDLEGKRISGNKFVYFRPSFRFTPNDQLDITLTTEFIRQRGDGTTSLNPSYDPRTPANTNCGGPSTAGTPTAYNCNTSLFEVLYPGYNQNYFGDGTTGLKGDKNANPYRVGYSLPYNNSDLNSYTATLNADYHTDFGTFSFLGNYANQKSVVNTDTDGTNLDFFSSTRFEDYETYQFEAHFVSDFSETVDMIAGLFYLYDTYQLGQLLWTPGIGKHTYNNPGMAEFQNGQERKTWAAYTQFEVHLTDELSAVAGIRYSWEKKFNVYEVPNNTIKNQGLDPNSDWSKFPLGDKPFCSPTGTKGTAASPCVAYFGPVDNSWDNFAPRVGLNYKVTDDVLLFAFWQRAYKSGGFVNNASEYSTFVQPYGEELIDNFEAGFKTEWLDSRLQLNGNLYYQKLKGLQRQVIRPANNTTGQETFITNAANARSYGFELEMVAIPVDGLTLNANLAYNNIKYTSYCADLDGPEATSTPSNGRPVCGAGASQLPNGTWIVPTDFKDIRIQFAPKIIANFGWTYDFPIGDDGNISIGNSFGYTSKMATAGVPLPRSDRRSMLLIDAQVSWESPSGQYRVSVWGKNLSNEIERLSVTPVSNLFSFEQGTTPRTYGITLTADF